MAEVEDRRLLKAAEARDSSGIRRPVRSPLGFSAETSQTTEVHSKHQGKKRPLFEKGHSSSQAEKAEGSHTRDPAWRYVYTHTMSRVHLYEKGDPASALNVDGPGGHRNPDVLVESTGALGDAANSLKTSRPWGQCPGCVGSTADTLG